MNLTNTIVANSTSVEQAQFYKKTYAHVAFAVLAFIFLESLLLKIVPESAIEYLLSGSYIWLFVIGLFWLGGTISNRFAFAETKEKQYLGLGIYVILEAIIFLPLIYVAMYSAGTGVIMQAALITLSMFTGLTAVVFFTNTDFSFLKTALIIGGFIALGTIVVGAIFGFDLGLWFSVAIVVLASASILYQTHQIKNEYATHQYVGAALQLFASIMLLFWYVLRILMSRD